MPPKRPRAAASKRSKARRLVKSPLLDMPNIPSDIDTELDIYTPGVSLSNDPAVRRAYIALGGTAPAKRGNTSVFGRLHQYNPLLGGVAYSLAARRAADAIDSAMDRQKRMRDRYIPGGVKLLPPPPKHLRMHEVAEMTRGIMHKAVAVGDAGQRRRRRPACV